MAIRQIVKEGDEILTKRCREVTEFNHKLSVLIDDMFDTMYEANGVGLAAPQVGILKRIVVIDTGEQPIELINPQIISESGKQQDMEGCLSCPGVYGITERPMYVKVKAQNRKGQTVEYEGEELLARAICHELDHLDGILFRSHVVEYIDVNAPASESATEEK